MKQHFPTQNDLTSTDRLERVIRDIYTRIYAIKPVKKEEVKAVEKKTETPSIQTVVKIIPSDPVAAQQQIVTNWAVGTPTDVTQEQGSSTPYVTTADEGKTFYNTDRNAIYRVVGGAWKYVAGVMRGTLSPDQKPSLGADDAGFIFYSTDFKHFYLWDGAAWGYMDDGARYIVESDVAAPPTGGSWQVCDGSTVDISTSTGGTASLAVPVKVGNYYLRK